MFRFACSWSQHALSSRVSLIRRTTCCLPNVFSYNSSLEPVLKSVCTKCFNVRTFSGTAISSVKGQHATRNNIKLFRCISTNVKTPSKHASAKLLAKSANLPGSLRWTTRLQKYSTSSPTTLFSSGSDNAPQSPVQVDLDLESRLSQQNLGGLRRNLTSRGCDLDLDQLLADYQKWQELDEVKVRLESERSLVAKTMAALVKGKKSQDQQKEKEGLTQRGKAIKEQLRDIMPAWWAAEQAVMLQALRLPADLHPLTPADEDQETDILEGCLMAKGTTSHVELAEPLGLLKFSHVGCRAVYLLGELAELEQSLLHYASTALRERGFSPFAAPEIFRSVVVEGCGLDPSADDQILSLHQTEEEQETNAYHLKGNSLLSYAAFLTKMQLSKNNLPVKMFSVGRHYQPEKGQDLLGMYGPVQSNRVTMFGAGWGQDQVNQLYTEMESALWTIAQGLGLPARKVLVSARKLAPSESLRAEVHVWAPALQQYVQMAHVSIHGDYASSRLMCRTTEGKAVHMVSGVAMDTMVVLASTMEHSSSEGCFSLPELPFQGWTR